MHSRILGFVLLAGALVLVGCQSTQEYVGSGHVYLSKRSSATLQAYLGDPRGEYFAVSTDGKTVGASICAEGRFGCEESGGALAIKACEQGSDGVPCKVYAVGDRIVWRDLSVTGKLAEKVPVEVGRGSIDLSERTQRRFESYLELENPEYFAVSLDGRFSGGAACRIQPCLHPGLKEFAISSCVEASAGLDCRLYAIKRKIVWQ